jgi:L-2-hydroxyglutarate oxidase LhgO
MRGGEGTSLCALDRHGIDFKRVGKLIVAANTEEVAQLETLWEKAKGNGVNDLKMLSGREVRRMEPNVAGIAALL